MTIFSLSFKARLADVLGELAPLTGLADLSIKFDGKPLTVADFLRTIEAIKPLRSITTFRLLDWRISSTITRVALLLFEMARIFPSLQRLYITSHCEQFITDLRPVANWKQLFPFLTSVPPMMTVIPIVDKYNRAALERYHSYAGRHRVRYVDYLIKNVVYIDEF